MSYNVLVPLDGSPVSEKALRPAQELAAHKNGRLLLLRAVPPIRPVALDPVVAVEPTTEEDVEVVRGYLKRHQAALADDVEVEIRARIGEPTPIIIEESSEADILVMASHGWSGFDRFLLGSITEGVVRSLQKPVLVVRSQPLRLEEVRRILVPLDGSEFAERALGPAQDMARLSGATLVLCQVLDTAHLDQTLPAILEGRRRETEPIKKYLAAKAAALDPEVKATTIWTVGSPARAILQLCAQQQIDLVVMATHGRGGLKRLLLGSIAENVVRASDCPVLLVPKA